MSWVTPTILGLENDVDAISDAENPISQCLGSWAFQRANHFQGEMRNG
jgi:hypothetical protein